MDEISTVDPVDGLVLTRREIFATLVRTATYNAFAAVPMVVPTVGIYAGIAGLFNTRDFSDSSLLFSLLVFVFGLVGSMVVGHISLGVERRPITLRNYKLACLSVQMTTIFVLICLFADATIGRAIVIYGYVYAQIVLCVAPILFLCGQGAALYRMGKIVNHGLPGLDRAVETVD